MRIAPHDGETLAGRERVGHGVHIGQLRAVCRPQAIPDRKPGQLIGICDPRGLRVLVARITLFLSGENDLAAADYCGCTLMIGRVHAKD